MQYKNYKELLEICQNTGCSIGAIALKKESQDKEIPESDLQKQMADVYLVMKESALSGLKQTTRSPSGLSGGDAAKVSNAATDKSFLSPMLKDALAMGLAVNETSAAQGKIVACPTAGSCGILPAAILSYEKHHSISQEAVINALFTAGAIGQIIEANACIAGAKGGCQAECGTAAAMAAGALIELSGGTPEQVVQAATLAIKNLLGLACDPVAGLVEVPCVKRNGILSAYSFIAAEMAQTGIKSAIPPDEVVDAMFRIGQMLPSALRETAEGGLAVTPTGLKWKKIITES